MRLTFGLFPRTETLHITSGFKTSGQRKTRRSLKWGSCEDVEQTNCFLHHESCSSGVGIVFAGNSGSSVSWSPWHGLGQWLPPGLQLPVPPRGAYRGHQELLQWAGRLRPLVVFWVPVCTWGSGGAHWLLVGWHQPCRDWVVGVYQWFSDFTIVFECICHDMDVESRLLGGFLMYNIHPRTYEKISQRSNLHWYKAEWPILIKESSHFKTSEWFTHVHLMLKYNILQQLFFSWTLHFGLVHLLLSSSEEFLWDQWKPCNKQKFGPCVIKWLNQQEKEEDNPKKNTRHVIVIRKNKIDARCL